MVNPILNNTLALVSPDLALDKAALEKSDSTQLANDNPDSNADRVLEFLPKQSKQHILNQEELPSIIKKKFITSDQAPGKFLFHDSQRLAFIDDGAKISTELDRPDVIESMIVMAKEKGWTKITVKGSAEFKREAWLQARLEGLEVNGFTPKPEDLAILEQKATLRAKNSILGVSESRANQAPGKVIVPDHYKPSPEAIAAMEHLQNKGISQEKIRVAMYGVDINNQIAKQIGVPEFQVRLFDAQARPQPTGKGKSIAIEPKKQAIQQPSIKR